VTSARAVYPLQARRIVKSVLSITRS